METHHYCQWPHVILNHVIMSREICNIIGFGKALSCKSLSNAKRVLNMGISKDPKQEGLSINPLRQRQNAAIFQTTFSNAFSWMKMYEFRLRFHCGGGCGGWGLGVGVAGRDNINWVFRVPIGFLGAFGLAPSSSPMAFSHFCASHCWNIIWLIVYWIPSNKLHWNLDQNTNVYFL